MTSATAHEVPVLPDEILDNIFLRLDAVTDIVRASTACKSHRRVICKHRFLHWYRFLHPPPVLGFLESKGKREFHNAEMPHKSAPAAISLAQTTDFTFSFLPMKPNKKR